MADAATTDPGSSAVLYQAQPEPNNPEQRVEWHAGELPASLTAGLTDSLAGGPIVADAGKPELPPAREDWQLPVSKLASDKKPGDVLPVGDLSGSEKPVGEMPDYDRDFLAAATQKLIDDLRVMKRTRFNAQGRFEAKHAASVAAFTLATVFEIGLSLWGTNFSGAMAANATSFIEFASQITAVFILGFGLVAGLASYQTKARNLQRCAMDWGSLSRELQIARPVNRDELQDFRRRYHEIEASCPENHAQIDYRKATLDLTDAKAQRINDHSYFINVYLIYSVTGIGYICFFVMGLWLALA